MTRRKVLISSTARDLPEHRDEIRLGCERAGFEPCVMEHLPALDADAIKASLRMVDDADVYVGVFAYRYGYVPDGHDISITEMEYNRAVELKKPRLIFFAHKDHPIKIEDVETGPAEAKLKGLKDRLGKERVVTFFRSSKDLRAQVVEALTTLGKEFDRERAGDAVASVAARLHRTTSISNPPRPYVAHPYTLLQSRELVGRQAELNMLTDWIINPGSPAFAARILCLVAIGGMGKSALTWQWFNQIAPNEMKPLAGRMWWSFYESDATFESFLNRALCYVSGQSEEAVRSLNWQEREAQLLKHLSDKPYLFVLDGLERILIAYNRMDASSLADDDYDKRTANWVAGVAGLPSSAAQSFTGEHRLRQTTDARAGAFLRRLAQVAESRTLITTRLYPYALQLPTTYPCPGSAAYFLRGLSDDDALALWRALKVEGARAELIPIFRSVESHPLLIQALASEVANYRKTPGDFAAWRVNHPQFDPTSLPLAQSRTHILEFALRSLSTKVREVLNTVVGFRTPTSYATLEALLIGSEKACRSTEELDQALTELEDRGLIGWDREANRYDAHPIVRGVVWQLTDAKDQRAVYNAIEAHFEPMATPEWRKVETLASLAPAIERYHTLIGLRRYDDAFDLFWDKLEDATLYRLATHRERIGWLEHLFPEGIAGPSALTTGDADQGRALNSLALSYQHSGQPSRAVPLYRHIEKKYERIDRPRHSILSNLGLALSEVGALREAQEVLQRSLVLARRSGDQRREGTILVIFGRLLGLIGESRLSHLALIRGIHLFIKHGNLEGEGRGLTFQIENWLRIKAFAKAKALVDEVWQLAIDYKLQRDLIHISLLHGQSALGLGNFPLAYEHLHDALTGARAVNMVEYELPALIALAEVDLLRGHTAEATARIDDVWDSAELGPYPLQQSDAYNVLAAIALAENNKAAAIDTATKAYKAAWRDGPPYAYHWGLEKAKAHLAALGAPEPDLPPFDESRFEPLPEVEINPKDEYWIDPDKLD